ncbi:MAG: hypothetical protein L3J57_14850 [Desulfuromusa sp.]|nr:hypothetical protein [Desulfuromusa sp.]
MKKILIFILLVLLSQPALAMNKNEIVKYFISNQEPTAKDALWSAPDVFKVGVIDNKSNRNGYAQYVCSVLAESGLSRGTWVQIMDIQKIVYQNKWVRLGEAHCR